MDEPLAPTETLLQALDARAAVRRATRAKALGAATQPYLRAAAVLHVFDPLRLRPVDAPADADDPPVLLRHSVPAVGWRHRGLRTLRLEIRRTALRALGSRAAMRAALESNPARTVTGLQRHFERWLDGDTFEPERMTFVELEDLRQLYTWGLDDLPGLAPLGSGLPPLKQVDQARARRSAVAVFEHLVDEAFVGRSAELRILEEHLLPSPDGRPRGPLAIWGPGGTGKTALVGRFLIRYLERSRGWFPFAYLPFDSETLDIREPFTLLVAIASQLHAQADSSPDLRTDLAAQLQQFGHIVADYRDRRGSLQRRANEFTERGERITSLSSADIELYDAFAHLLEVASRGEHGPTPILLVFDTFEEVVYRAAEDLLGFWLMLDHLQGLLPQLRVIIAGRGQPNTAWTGQSSVTELRLNDLEQDDAVRLLAKLGIDDVEIARALARQIGGNPMSIRLAADIARTERPDRGGLKELATHNIGAELIRGKLYRRLLDHIHDEDVRALAHPGMVLRRVTTDIIKGVLAPACDLVGVDDARAEELLDGLQKEQALVSLEEDGSLRYREEVRRPVLELLERDQPVRVRLIHTYAVEHYQWLSEPAERAEELYHRMMLGQPAYQLDERWEFGVERYLASAIDELPPEQRRWLAGRMSIELAPEVYQLADLGEWERLIGRKAMGLVRHGGPEAVLTLLGERAERTPQSPLFAIEARALLDLKQAAQAAQLLDDALEGFPVIGNPGRLAEILWLRAQAAVAMGETGSCLMFLRQLIELTTSMRSTLAKAQALTEILGILNPRNLADADLPEVSQVREALSDALGRLTEAEVAQERSLIRLALVRLGPHYPWLVADLGRRTVFDLVYLAERGLVDLVPALKAVLAYFADELPQLGHMVSDPQAGVLIDQLVKELTQRTRPSATEPRSMAPLAEAVLTLLRTEGSTLAGSSLAGIDDYREPWELEFTREVAS